MSKFSLKDYVRKPSGAFWEGTIVGHYSTDQTPDGVAVQLFGWPNGPVQIYPAAALEPHKPSGVEGERCPGVSAAIAPENHDAQEGDWQKAASGTDYLGFAVQQIVWRGRRATIVDRDFPIGTPIAVGKPLRPSHGSQSQIRGVFFEEAARIAEQAAARFETQPCEEMTGGFRAALLTASDALKLVAWEIREAAGRERPRGLDKDQVVTDGSRIGLYKTGEDWGNYGDTIITDEKGDVCLIFNGRDDHAEYAELIRDLLNRNDQTPPPSSHVAGATIDRQRATKAAEAANQAYGQWMPERWLHLFLDAYEGKSK